MVQIMLMTKIKNTTISCVLVALCICVNEARSQFYNGHVLTGLNIDTVKTAWYAYIDTNRVVKVKVCNIDSALSYRIPFPAIRVVDIKSEYPYETTRYSLNVDSNVVLCCEFRKEFRTERILRPGDCGDFYRIEGSNAYSIARLHGKNYYIVIRTDYHQKITLHLDAKEPVIADVIVPTHYFHIISD